MLDEVAPVIRTINSTELDQQLRHNPILHLRHSFTDSDIVTYLARIARPILLHEGIVPRYVQH